MLHAMKTTHRPARLIVLLSCLLLVFAAAAQEQRVRPDINHYFMDPDWQQWVNTFERPGREVYDKRHAIVTASKVGPGMDIADIGAGTGLFTRLFAAAVEPGGQVYARRHAIVAASKVVAGMNVADIGAGTGLFTRLFAAAVEPGGQVYAIDISRTFIENILRTCREQGLSNVTGIVNTPTDIGLPAGSIDLAFVTDTYHHFEYPQQTLASIHQALRSDGRLIIIDFRRDPRISSGWVMRHVRGNKARVIEEVEAAGFRLVDDQPLLRTSYFLEFSKPGK